MKSRNALQMIELILDVARSDARILAVLQDGSRSNPNVVADIFQDFDIIYVVKDLSPFLEDHDWIDVFGERIITQMPEDMELYPPSPELKGAFSYLMQFTDGNRIDLLLVTLNHLDEFTNDSLCKVLWDKAGIFHRRVLPEASEATYIVQKPSFRSFNDCCNEFWYTNSGLVKGLWRGEVVLVQELLNRVIRVALLQMMDWYIGCRHNFAVNPGKNGKFYQRYLEPQLYEKLLATYPPATLPKIWKAVYESMDLFGIAARFVAAELDYTYRQDWDQKVTSYMRHVQQLPQEAKTIY
ncbi:aminoglycoside 6-adenylyltransferase [Dyadobacter sp. MSC1_007]